MKNVSEVLTKRTKAYIVVDEVQEVINEYKGLPANANVFSELETRALHIIECRLQQGMINEDVKVEMKKALYYTIANMLGLNK